MMQTELAADVTETKAEASIPASLVNAQKKFLAQSEQAVQLVRASALKKSDTTANRKSWWHAQSATSEIPSPTVYVGTAPASLVLSVGEFEHLSRHQRYLANFEKAKVSGNLLAPLVQDLLDKLQEQTKNKFGSKMQCLLLATGGSQIAIGKIGAGGQAYLVARNSRNPDILYKQQLVPSAKKIDQADLSTPVVLTYDYSAIDPAHAFMRDGIILLLSEAFSKGLPAQHVEEAYRAFVPTQKSSEDPVTQWLPKMALALERVTAEGLLANRRTPGKHVLFMQEFPIGNEKSTHIINFDIHLHPELSSEVVKFICLSLPTILNQVLSEVAFSLSVRQGDTHRSTSTSITLTSLNSDDQFEPSESVGVCDASGEESETDSPDEETKSAAHFPPASCQRFFGLFRAVEQHQLKQHSASYPSHGLQDEAIKNMLSTLNPDPEQLLSVPLVRIQASLDQLRIFVAASAASNECSCIGVQTLRQVFDQMAAEIGLQSQVSELVLPSL